ncbi:hypothetical protein [Mucilaginibacter sp.]|uniref:hypothetical protein n=1 Tax=Mucilaginibacter sp. TaxID=1882438 RepID=UPI003567B541
MYARILLSNFTDTFNHLFITTMLTENNVTDLLASYLENQDYKIINKITSKDKGIDLVVETPKGIRQYIEVKGETSGNETSKRFNLPFTGNQIWTHVSVAIMKTLMLMNKPENNVVEFGMAFPFNHEILLKSIKPSIEKLGIVVYLISREEVKIL